MFKNKSDITKKSKNIYAYSKELFQNSTKRAYANPAFAKSEAERGNSNNLLVANDSTPLTRAFFVRGIRTPKERQSKIGSALLSMVGRNGQGSTLGCLPLVAVFHPVTSYRQAWKLAVDTQKSTSGAFPMLYKFLCLNRTKPTYNQETVWIEADSEQDARFQLTADYRLLLDRPIAKFAKNPANLTRCKVAHSPMADEPEQNHSLPTVANVGSIARTTTFNADRKRYLSGIFLPTIHQGCGLTTPVIYSELAVRATRRTKAGNRANNADCLKAVVEPLPHPIQVQAVSFSNKLTRTFKMLFKFLFTGSRLRIAVHAKTLADAYKRLPTPQPNSVPVLIARIPAKGVCYA